jgi:hypothetical protein
MYGFGDFQPSGYVFFASSSVTDPEMITSSPCFQFTGVGPVQDIDAAVRKAMMM